MKKLTKIISVLLMAVFIASFAGCGKYNKILKAFEDNGYNEADLENSLVLGGVVKTINDNLKNVFDMASDDGESDATMTVHVLNKQFEFVCVLEFTSTKELAQELAENEKLMNMFKDAQESDYVNGNCILFFGGKEAKEIFKDA